MRRNVSCKTVLALFMELAKVSVEENKMSTFLPQEVQAGLDAARTKAVQKSKRLKIKTESGSFPVLRVWHNGFSIEAALAPVIRGHVDLYDGERHLLQGLIIASEDQFGEWHYEFKRQNLVTDAPPVDFHRRPNAPAALLGSVNSRFL